MPKMMLTILASRVSVCMASTNRRSILRCEIKSELGKGVVTRTKIIKSNAEPHVVQASQCAQGLITKFGHLGFSDFKLYGACRHIIAKEPLINYLRCYCSVA